MGGGAHGMMSGGKIVECNISQNFAAYANKTY